MKISFLGSRHNILFQKCLRKDIGLYFNSGDFYFDDGVEHFYDSIIGDSEFHKQIKDSDFIFLDLFSDRSIAADRYNYIKFIYQKLIWYIFSISPNSEINIVNFLSYDVFLGGYEKLIENLNFENASISRNPTLNKIYLEDDELILNTCSEILSIPNNADSTKVLEEESRMSSVLLKLKNKKEFETTHEKV